MKGEFHRKKEFNYMDEQGYPITLVCFNCGKKVHGIIERPMQFAFELVEIAKQAGMYGVFDMYHSRALVFCDEECANQQKTKRGTFRLRPKKLA
jgi:hypothetical protein